MVEIAASGADPFPASQRREPGGSIRRAVGAPDGPRSHSWSLFGSTNDNDVYLGPRSQTGAIKLSLQRQRPLAHGVDREVRQVRRDA
jgi:hypothetical protein